MDMKQETNYYMRYSLRWLVFIYLSYSERLDTTGVSDLASVQGHEGTRTNQGSCIIYITSSEHAQSMTRAIG